MSSSSSPSSQLLLIQNLVGDFYSRRLLLHNPLNQQSSTASSPPPSATSDENPGDNSFDANVVMVLSVLLCALICSLGLNSIIRCALRCSSIVASESPNSSRSANTGVKKKALKTFPTVSYSPDLNLPGLETECVICLSDFTAGERVRLLPKCNHGFHVRCIDKWLSSHSSCPKCRHNLLETCHKIVGCNRHQTSSLSMSPPPVPDTVVIIAPLEPEGLIRNYRETS